MKTGMIKEEADYQNNNCKNSVKTWENNGANKHNSIREENALEWINEWKKWKRDDELKLN